jgi:hypothetical protein
MPFVLIVSISVELAVMCLGEVRFDCLRLLGAESSPSPERGLEERCRLAEALGFVFLRGRLLIGGAGELSLSLSSSE